MDGQPVVKDCIKENRTDETHHRLSQSTVERLVARPLYSEFGNKLHHASAEHSELESFSLQVFSGESDET